MKACAALALLAALALPAHAGAPMPASSAPMKYRPPIPAPPPSPPDPSAVEQATDANFDDDAPHHGFLIAGAIGPSDQVSFGSIDHSSGAGLGFSLRLGAAASRRVALLFAIDSTSYLIQVNGGTTKANTSQVFSLGPQIYLRDALWLRGGIGFASFQRRAGTTMAPEKIYAGPGGHIGAGVDIFRRNHFVLSVELTLVGAIYKEGFVGGGFMSLGAAYD